MRSQSCRIGFLYLNGPDGVMESGSSWEFRVEGILGDHPVIFWNSLDEDTEAQDLGVPGWAERQCPGSQPGAVSGATRPGVPVLSSPRAG